MSTESPYAHQVEQVKTWWRLIVLAGVVAGLVALVLGIGFGGTRQTAGAGVVFAVFFWCGAAYVHLTWLAEPNPGKRTHRVETERGVEFRIGLRPQPPLTLVLVGVALVVFFGYVAIALGSVGWVLAGGVFALLGLAVLPDAIRALAAPNRGAVVNADGFTYNGYSYETRVGWDDIASGDLDRTNKRTVTIEFRLRPGAPLAWTRRRWIAQIEPTPRADRFKIPAANFDQPWNLLALCEGMAQEPAEHRAGYLGSVGTRMLTDPAFPRQ